MTGFFLIDVHSHILPGIDDGAQTLEDALKLLAMAVEDGIKTQVLTPHIQPSRYQNDPDSLRVAFTEFTNAVRAHDIPINLLLSAEVRIGPEVMDLVQREDFPWLGTWQDKRALLLELPYNNVPVGSLNLIDWLVERDILPIIPHPERTSEIQQDINKLVPFIEAGCKFQVTAASLLGNFGQKARMIAEELLREDQVMLLATDCHNVAYRPPVLKAGVAAAAEIIGEQRASALVNDNPAELLHNNNHNVINTSFAR